MKKAGALVAVSSLPSAYGVGDFGPQAYEYIDILAQMKLKVWQVLPLNPLGYGNSPYQPYSSFAGDDIYISIDKLVADGLLNQSAAVEFKSNATIVDYCAVRAHKTKMLQTAFANFMTNSQLKAELEAFVAKTSWVYNYAVFVTFKKANQHKAWNLWPSEYKSWIKDKKLDLSVYKEQIDYELFLQFIFSRQWLELKAYANSKNIEIMGDIPIYLGFDSLDVWENQDMFLLDAEQNPTFVAGVPPDYFSVTGQRWGNPIYNWENLAKSNFKFWIDRLQGNMQAFDIIRIDHFRAFDTYWQIPASCPTAIDGEWVEAPGYALFDTIYKELPGIKIVVEDLGDLRPEVLELRDHYKLPGMQIFQFVFDVHGENGKLKELVNTIIYTGTHDNSTLMGWYWSLNTWNRKLLKRFFKANDMSITHKMLQYSLNCNASYVIFPAQDILGLGDYARMNFPSTIGSPNWEWKMANLAGLKAEATWLGAAVSKSGR